MQKFTALYKEKKDRADQLQESIIIKDFKKVYSALLEKYEITSVHELDEKTQNSFLSQVSECWDEQSGLTEKGAKFVKTRSTFLNESSTTLQKKNYLKTKVKAVVSESIKQGELKWKIYDVIDSVFTQIKAANISEVMSPLMISNIINESVSESMNDLISTIKNELTESAKPAQKTQAKFVVKIDARK